MDDTRREILFNYSLSAERWGRGRGGGWAALSQVTRLCSVPLVRPQLLLGKQRPPNSPSATRPPVPLCQTILSRSAEAINHFPFSSRRPDLHCYFEEDTLESYELMKLKKKINAGRRTLKGYAVILRQSIGDKKISLQECRQRWVDLRGKDECLEMELFPSKDNL